MEDELELLKAMFTEDELTITLPSVTASTSTSTSTGKRNSSSSSQVNDESWTLVTLRLTGTGTSITVNIVLPSRYPDQPPAVTFERARIADEVHLMKEIQALITDRISNGMVCLYDIIELVRTSLLAPLTCFICFEPVENDDTTYASTNHPDTVTAVLPTCGHVLHTACLAPWFWRLIENGRKSSSHTVLLQRDKQEKSTLKNIVERAENNVQQYKLRCQSLETELETMNKQLASAKILAAHSVSIQQQSQQQNRKRENNGKNSKKGSNVGNDNEEGITDIGALSLTDLTKIINELQTELKTNQRNLHTAITKLETAVKTAQENNVSVSNETLNLLNAGNNNAKTMITNSTSTIVKNTSTQEVQDDDMLEHLELCKHGLTKDTKSIHSNTNNTASSSVTTEPLLKCPVCRTVVPYSSSIHRWYEPWLTKEHPRYRAKDEQDEREKSKNIDVVSPPPLIHLPGIRRPPPDQSSSSSSSTTTSSSSPSATTASSIIIPSEITDPVIRASLEKFALQWYNGYQHAIEIGGIIGTSTPLPTPKSITSPIVPLSSSSTSNNSTGKSNRNNHGGNRK